MNGRLFKIFLPLITGLVLAFFATANVLQPVVAGRGHSSPSPSPSPSTEPCDNQEQVSFWDFLNIDVEAHHYNPSPTPCPSPSPSPSPSPEPSPVPTPPVGGEPGPSLGGNVTTPACPTDRHQKVDQVWFSDIKPGQVTVHWANKGDAAGFHIAYGPTADNLIWGVEVAGDFSQYTLKDLPGGDLWVAIIAKASADCGGPTSDTVKVGAIGGQVLGATGVASGAVPFSAGLGPIAP